MTSELFIIKNAKDFNAKAFAEAALAVKDEDGRIKPRDIWKAAENNPSHPAYKHIEWDDAKAAGMHRDDQVRAMLRSVSILLPGMTNPVPRFHSLTVERGGAGGYREVTEIVASEYMTVKLLEQAEQEFLAWRKRYDRLVDIGEYAKGIEAAIRKGREKTTRSKQQKEMSATI